MCDKITIIDHQHKVILPLWQHKPEFWFTKDEMLVALADHFGHNFELLKFYASVNYSLVGKGQIDPFFIFLGAISDCNTGFQQWHSLAETLNI